MKIEDVWDATNDFPLTMGMLAANLNCDVYIAPHRVGGGNRELITIGYGCPSIETENRGKKSRELIRKFYVKITNIEFKNQYPYFIFPHVDKKNGHVNYFKVYKFIGINKKLSYHVSSDDMAIVKFTLEVHKTNIPIPQAHPFRKLRPKFVSEFRERFAR